MSASFPFLWPLLLPKQFCTVPVPAMVNSWNITLLHLEWLLFIFWSKAILLSAKNEKSRRRNRDSCFLLRNVGTNWSTFGGSIVAMRSKHFIFSKLLLCSTSVLIFVIDWTGWHLIVFTISWLVCVNMEEFSTVCCQSCPTTFYTTSRMSC